MAGSLGREVARQRGHDDAGSRINVPAGRYTSGYRAELSALAGALRFLRSVARIWRPRRVLICTDSQSAIRRLEEGPGRQTDALASQVWHLLKSICDGGASIHLQWVPGLIFL